MKKDYYSLINNYDEERDNSILLSNSNQNIKLFQPQESIFFPDEQQNINKFSLSNYNEDIMYSPSLTPSEQFSPFPSLNSNEEDTNKSTLNNSNNHLKPDYNKPILNNSQKTLDEISGKDKKKIAEIIEKNSNDGKLSQIDKEKLTKDLAEKIKENKLNLLMNKKRKSSRIHLEDLNIDPKLIEKQSYQTIGDKVITSKKKLTEDDKKEVRAIRNRISAQKIRNRKKEEYINMIEEMKILKTKITLQNLLIKKYKEVACTSCQKIFEKIDEEFAKNYLNFKEDDKEYLTLEENSTIFNKLSINFAKLTSAVVGLICLIGIIFCVFQNNYSFSKTVFEIENNHDTITLRQLSNNEQKLNNESESKKVPTSKKKNFTAYEKYFSTIQMYHNKFVYDAYGSYKTSKKKQKNGFLINKKYYENNESICLDSTNIKHNYYVLDNEFMNTLPVKTETFDLNNKLSNKIISMLVKDYDTLKRVTNGKDLSFQEQIESEAKKSDDGCVYIQIIVPKFETEESQIRFGNYNKTYTNDPKSYFEVRCKIMQINSYDSKITPVYSEI